LEDKGFDSNAKSQKFDVSAWAREYFIEANMHNLTKEEGSTGIYNLLEGVRLNITETQLSGVNQVPAGPSDLVQQITIPRKVNSKSGLPELKELNWIVTVEPQAIRTFNIEYYMPNL